VVSQPGGQSDLLATLQTEIIPRLLLAHRTNLLSSGLCAEFRPPPSPEEVFEFARIAACHDLNGALRFVESRCSEGLSLESILLDLVAPAARLLGEQWQADLRSFTEVCAGLGTIQQVVHVLGPSFAPALPHRGLVVLVAAPGEQHTLGLYLVGEFLRRAGWGVQVSPTMSEPELVDLVASEQVEMIGITVSNDHLLEPLASLIESVRSASRNPGLTVMLGGSTSIDLGAYAARHGAFGCAADPHEVLRLLEHRATVREHRS
jgi:methanogenic corrinoid protein MtbC1